MDLLEKQKGIDKSESKKHLSSNNNNNGNGKEKVVSKIKELQGKVEKIAENEKAL